MNNEIIEISLLKEKCNKSNRQIEICKHKKMSREPILIETNFKHLAL